MLISCRWLESWIVGAPLESAEIALALTALGLEVESVKTYDALDNVVAARVLSLSTHPASDRLTVVMLDDGGPTQTQVVCGARNLPAEGGLVAFARVGARLPGGITLAARETRGVTSHGMICSEQELGIGPDGDGILILDHAAAPGVALCELAPCIHDTVIEIAVTPNRPDALGHLGVARDLSVRFRRALKVPSLVELPGSLEGLASLEAPAACGKYIAVAIDDLTVRPSDLDTRVRLHRLGMRAIDVVVDATNLAALEFGQPQHVFDRDKLEGGAVRVRLASGDEPITTLDAREIKLRDEDLVIADARRPHALAGIMGGKDSGVSGTSRRGLLEVAYFDPSVTRRSAKAHGFHTEASHRFERGVDHGEILMLSLRATLTRLTAAGARAVGMQICAGQVPPREAIQFRPARATALLGVEIPAQELLRIFAGLGIQSYADEPQREPVLEFNATTTPRWWCVPPSFRPDLKLEVDLIEEGMRHFGIEQIPDQHSAVTQPVNAPAHNPMRMLVNELGPRVRAMGYFEHVGLAFAEESENAEVHTGVPAACWVMLRNPMRAAQQYLRVALIPGLLSVVAINRARHDRVIATFELGRVYRWPVTGEGEPRYAESTAAIDSNLAVESTRLGLIRHHALAGDLVAGGERVRELAREAVELLHGLGLAVTLCNSANGAPWAHPGISAVLRESSSNDAQGGVVLGYVGQVHPDLVRGADIRGTGVVAYAEIDLDALLLALQRKVAATLGAAAASPVARFCLAPSRFIEPSRVPGTSRDVSIEIPASLSAGTVIAALDQAARDTSPLAAVGIDVGKANAAAAIELAPPSDSPWSITLHEDYRDEKIGADRRALLLRMGYQQTSGTVTDEASQRRHEEILALACERLAAAWGDVRRR